MGEASEAAEAGADVLDLVLGEVDVDEVGAGLEVLDFGDVVDGEGEDAQVGALVQEGLEVLQDVDREVEVHDCV